MFITHDETIFYTNNNRKSECASNNEQSLQKKGQGLSIHISDFFCEIIEYLCLHNEQNILHKARVIIHLSKN